MTIDCHYARNDLCVLAGFVNYGHPCPLKGNNECAQQLTECDKKLQVHKECKERSLTHEDVTSVGSFFNVEIEHRKETIQYMHAALNKRYPKLVLECKQVHEELDDEIMQLKEVRDKVLNILREHVEDEYDN